MAQVHLGDGAWLIADCGSMPSDNNCKMVMTAPSEQKENLLDALEAHAVKHHNHQESAELRGKLEKTLVELK